jgi:NADH-quinone oxidoreductase subunit J
MLSQAVTHLMFYAFAALAVCFAIAVVSSRRILRAAVCLMSVLAISAGFYVLLGAYFLAGVQILVYVGGIVVVLVFAIMLTSSAELLDDKPSLVRKVAGLLAAGSFFVITVWMFYLTDFPARRAGILTGGDTAELGRRLLNYGPQGYVLPFEIISLLLLSAAIGGIVLARKVNPKREA